MTIATDLANRICALTFDTLPPEAVHWARVGIIDTIGVTLAGAIEPCAVLARRVAAPAPGNALLFGTATRTAPAEAAWVNGTASHALDFDDCSNTLGGHPSAPVLPALFALADGTALSGRALITAYIAGFETETRIAHAVNFYHYEKGWHPTATLGVFGAAAACASLLRLTPEQTATALAIAASFSSGLKANFGTMTKPLHVGQSGRNGLVAALLAREGFTASFDAMEHPQGFFRVFNGEGNFDADAVLRDWGAPLDIVTPGIAIKQYPCCGSTHPAVDAMLHLVRQHRLKPEQVERVVSRTHKRRLRHTNRPHLRSALDAKFSVQYCLARALLDGRVVLSQFEGEAHEDPRITDLMARIEATPQPDVIPDDGKHFGADVEVFTKDGSRYAHSVEQPLGRTSENPLPQW
ncbi:MAG TPA: MmgE/PrpD family protein, partial [Acetobacteraceae bacterium]|nr:MmgE/PrpD family protein [Acetobacteraceae bacterium]